MEKKNVSILVVDDEFQNRELLRRFFALQGITCVRLAANGQEAKDAALSGPFDIAFVDVNLPGMPGFEVVRILKETVPEARFVMISGYSAEDFPQIKEEPAIIGFLEKPFDFASIMAQIERVCGEKR